MTYIFSEPWLLFVAVAALLFACSSVGYELSKRTHINDVAHHHEQISGLRDGLFALLGLLLGFTIAMVLPRFDQRQELVVEEANAIRTAMMRAAMLAMPPCGFGQRIAPTQHCSSLRAPP
jgi:cbb3-type cytochrome oxidase subunit 1